MTKETIISQPDCPWMNRSCGECGKTLKAYTNRILHGPPDYNGELEGDYSFVCDNPQCKHFNEVASVVDQYPEDQEWVPLEEVK